MNAGLVKTSVNLLRNFCKIGGFSTEKLVIGFTSGELLTDNSRIRPMMKNILSNIGIESKQAKNGKSGEK